MENLRQASFLHDQPGLDPQVAVRRRPRRMGWLLAKCRTNRREGAGLPAWSSSEAVGNNPFSGMSRPNPKRGVEPAHPLHYTFAMGDGPATLDETTRTALPLEARRDAWLEQRLGYLAGELARLKGGPPLRRFLRGPWPLTAASCSRPTPAHRFHCWATLQAVSAGLDQIEHRGDRPEVAGSAPDGPDPGQALTVGLTDQPH